MRAEVTIATLNGTLIRLEGSSKIIPSERRCSGAGTQPLAGVLQQADQLRHRGRISGGKIVSVIDKVPGHVMRYPPDNSLRTPPSREREHPGSL